MVDNSQISDDCVSKDWIDDRSPYMIKIDNQKETLWIIYCQTSPSVPTIFFILAQQSKYLGKLMGLDLKYICSMLSEQIILTLILVLFPGCFFFF